MSNKSKREELCEYATEYTIGDYKIAWRGKSWGVYKDGFCYDESNECFILEPSPSNRDDDFFEIARFSLIRAKEIVDELNSYQQS